MATHALSHQFSRHQEGSMSSTAQTASLSRSKLWSARIINALVVLFLLFDLIVKLLRLPVAVQANIQLGYPESTVLVIGIIELLCLVTYLIPRTSVFGAILLTGYLGGAIASQLRAGNPLFSHTLFPIYVALLVWAPLFLRDERVRTLIPVRK
jgi:DoxX-like family